MAARKEIYLPQNVKKGQKGHQTYGWERREWEIDQFQSDLNNNSPIGIKVKIKKLGVNWIASDTPKLLGSVAWATKKAREAQGRRKIV